MNLIFSKTLQGNFPHGEKSPSGKYVLLVFANPHGDLQEDFDLCYGIYLDHYKFEAKTL